MLSETAQRIDTLLAQRTASDSHRATVARQLQEERQRRHQAHLRRSVRSATLSGIIRR